MNTKIITDMYEFRSIQEDWERLEQQDPDCAYYSTFRFNYSWWEAFGSDPQKELFLICCYRGHKLVGIAPLMIRRGNKVIATCLTLCFLGKGDYFSFLIDREDQAEMEIVEVIFQTIELHRQKWDKIEFTHLAQDTTLLHYLLRHDHYHAHVDYLTSCPIIDLQAYDSFEAFAKSGEIVKIRKTRDKFRRTVRYQFKVILGGQDDTIYERVSCIHKAQQEYLQYKGRTERRSLFDDPRTDDFLKGFLKENAQVVTFLLEDEAGEMIMYSINYLYKGTLYDWNSGYSPEYSYVHSLSNVLLLETVQYLYEHPLAERIDCGAGSYAWKFKWTRQFKVSYVFRKWNKAKRKVRLFHLLAGVRGIFLIGLQDIQTGMLL